MILPRSRALLQVAAIALIIVAQHSATLAAQSPVADKPLDDLLAIAGTGTGLAGQDRSQIQNERRNALESLSHRPYVSMEEESKIVATLRDLLCSPDPDLRRRAAATLGKRGHIEFLPQFLARIEEEPGLFRTFFFYQLNHPGVVALPVSLLRDGLLSRNPQARECVVEVIGWEKISALRPEVEDLLESEPPSSWVRREAALALHRIGSAESLPVLERMIQQDPPYDTAFNAIAALGSDAQVPVLLALLNSGNAKKKALALKALCFIKVKDPRPVTAALFHVLEQSGPDFMRVNDSYEPDALMVAIALAAYKDQRALPFLRQIVKTGRIDFMRERPCVRAIANLEGPESLALLHEMVQTRRFRGGEVEDALVQRADPSSAPVVWERYLQSPMQLVVSGWCATTGGYTDALRVLRVCADKEMAKKIRARAIETNERREKRALNDLLAKIDQRLAGDHARAPD